MFGTERNDSASGSFFTSVSTPPMSPHSTTSPSYSSTNPTASASSSGSVDRSSSRSLEQNLPEAGDRSRHRRSAGSPNTTSAVRASLRIRGSRRSVRTGQKRAFRTVTGLDTRSHRSVRSRYNTPTPSQVIASPTRFLRSFKANPLATAEVVLITSHEFQSFWETGHTTGSESKNYEASGPGKTAPIQPDRALAGRSSRSAADVVLCDPRK